jgi:predicted N-acetyltransferase YhbS
VDVPRSLAWATDIDVLALDRRVERRDGYLAIRSPSNPTYYWGNLLLFDEPPERGSAAPWEELFAAEFADEPRVRHVTLAWDRTDGAIGAAEEEFVSRGYILERTVGLIARPSEIAAHPRENRAVAIRALDPRGDEDAWEQVTELGVASRDPIHEEHAHRAFRRERLANLREHFARGDGAWYVASAGEEVVASCGVVVTAGRGRYQDVDTAEVHRRQGISSRLVVAAGHDAATRFGAAALVILADPDYHALGLYESLGFRAIEHTAGVMRMPPTADAN